MRGLDGALRGLAGALGGLAEANPPSTHMHPPLAPPPRWGVCSAAPWCPWPPQRRPPQTRFRPPPLHQGKLQVRVGPAPVCGAPAPLRALTVLGPKGSGGAGT